MRWYQSEGHLLGSILHFEGVVVVEPTPMQEQRQILDARHPREETMILSPTVTWEACDLQLMIFPGSVHVVVNRDGQGQQADHQAKADEELLLRWRSSQESKDEQNERQAEQWPRRCFERC